MKTFSLFSGVGGFELALPQDWTCLGFSEIDKYASAVLKYRFPNVPNYGDITKIDWNNVPDFDLLVGGSPCQDLSVAGKQKGLVGERSGLFYEYVKVLEIKKPAHFIWENVKGALSSNGGRDFATILNAFSEAGYSLTWQVLNAKDFGVPQNRERVFIVGTRGECEREVFFERGEDTKNLEYVGSASERDWAGDGKDLSRNAPQGSRIYSDNGIMPALAKETGGHGRVSGLVQLNKPRHSNNRVYSEDGISPTLNTMQGGSRQPFVQRQPLRFLDRNQKNIKGDYAFTVDAGQTSGLRVTDINWPSRGPEPRKDGLAASLKAGESGTKNRAIVYDRIRRLTPLECERLMSWPDAWTRYGNFDGVVKEISDSQRYKMCGNGVVSHVVKELYEAHFLLGCIGSQLAL